jgi:hypothetical protein
MTHWGFFGGRKGVFGGLLFGGGFANIRGGGMLLYSDLHKS